MQILEAIETHGYFWLNDQPDKRVWGILKVLENGKSSLELFGTFGDTDPFEIGTLHSGPIRIMGATAKKGPVTLDDCFVVQQNTTMNIDVFPETRFHVSVAYVGAHFEDKEILLSSVTFSVEGLDEWFHSHNRVFSSEGSPLGEMSIAFQPPKSISVELPDGFILHFCMSASKNLGMFQQSMSTRMEIQIDSMEIRPFLDYLGILRKIRNFLSFAFDRTVSFTFIRGYQRETNAQAFGVNSVDIYGAFDAYDWPKQNISIGWFFVSLEDVANNINKYIREWLDGYEEYEPTFDLYFAVAENRHMHLEGKFIFLVQGIESLHRRSSSETQMPKEEFDSIVKSILDNVDGSRREWIGEKLKYANEPSLRRRLSQMISPFDDLFDTNSERKRFVNDVVNTRNYYTHYDNCILEEAVTEPAQLLRLYLKLEALVQMHLLYLIGLDRDHVRKIVNRYQPLRQKLNFMER